LTPVMMKRHTVTKQDTTTIDYAKSLIGSFLG
jgi:hypothetical protein